MATRNVDYQCNLSAVEESYERVMDWNRTGTGTKTDREQLSNVCGINNPTGRLYPSKAP